VPTPPTTSTATPLVPSRPANSSIPRPSPSAPEEFQGAADNVRVVGASIFGAAVVVLIAGLL
jgi:hypothetical protein